jgi:hypothetical protein
METFVPHLKGDAESMTEMMSQYDPRGLSYFNDGTYQYSASGNEKRDMTCISINTPPLKNGHYDCSAGKQETEYGVQDTQSVYNLMVKI